jgi:Cys-tRNA(Pro)/Cys-tRNA(Cys) deacylase
VKTNAARLLDAKKIPYRVVTYAVDESDLSATTVARKVGMPPSQVYKTLLARGDKTGPLFALISADEELDLKALASATGNKKVELAPLKEVQPLTGYIRGGVSPLGAKKPYPVVLDERALAAAEIAISAGVRGAQLVLAPGALRGLVAAIVARIGKAGNG